MKKCFLFFALMFLSLASLQAQELKPPVNIQSPNAASLGKYGDIPVSYFTGTPNISIPIHSFKNKGIDLNLSLYYDASGVRIDQHPGSTGQNWSVEAGGVITRSVIGQPDELTWLNTNKYSNYPNVGFFYNYGLLNDANTSNTSLLSNFTTAKEHMGQDFQPDVFTFNFMGKTGKFFMDNDGRWKVASEDNIMVIFNGLTTPLFANYPNYPLFQNLYYPSVIAGFTLLDGDGNTYQFGNGNAIEYSIDFYRQGDRYNPDIWTANSWYLTKVIDKYGNDIYKFDYERGSFIAQFYRSYYTCSWNYDGNANAFRPAPGCATGTPMNPYDIEGNLISPVYLMQIYVNDNNSNDQIRFEYSNTTELEYDAAMLLPRYTDMKYSFYNYPGITTPLYYLQVNNPFIDPSVGDNYLANLHWRKLDGIAIFGNLNKKILFRYNNTLSQRLNLLGIDIISGDWPYNSPNYQKYSFGFDYNHFDLLPGYLSKKDDHWGFNNGSSYTVNSAYSGYYSQREPNASYLPFGMLSKITYPTGGYSLFQFERHDYSQIVSDDRSDFLQETGIAGGVRIRKITDCDGTSSIIRNFKYVTDYPSNTSSTNSSGILTCKPKYYWPDWRCAGPDGGEYSLSVFSNNSIIPLSNSFGSHIGYSEVIEYRDDGSYTQYKYSNFNTLSICRDQPPLLSFNAYISPYSKYIDMSLTRGKLTNRAVYNSSNSLLMENIFTYRLDASTMYSNYILATNTAHSLFCPGVSAEGYITGTSYKIYYFDYDQVQEETKDYLAGGTVSKITTYAKEDKPLTNLMGYSDLRLLKSTTNFLSDRNITTNYYYPTDLSTQTNVQLLIDKFRIDDPIKIITLSAGGTGTPSIGVNKTTFKLSSGLVVKDKEYYSKTDESHLEQIMSYDDYNSSGTLTQYTASNGIPVALLWDNTNNYLKAKIENAIYTQVSGRDGQAMTSDSKILSDDIKSLVPNAISSTYSYSPFVGMTSQTDPTGISTKYSYDLFGRLARITDFKGNIIKEYYYHFSNQPTAITNYYNSARTQNFYKQNCAANSTPAPYPYAVPANTYSSNISQGDADSQALNDINMNGQNAANLNGICYFLDPNFTNLNYSVAGSTQPVTISSNASYSATCSDAWITVSPASIIGNGTINITCSSNSGTPRTGIVTLHSTLSNGDITRTLTINQNGTFYNSLISQVFTKQGCTAGTTPGSFTYTVAANKYSSEISQADADAKAQNEINSNGQNAANTNCLCYYLNPATSSLSFPADNTQNLARTLMAIPTTSGESVTVSSNTTYTTSSMASWITITPASLTGDGILNISCTTNTGQARSSTVKLQSTPATGNITKLISISQAASSSSGSFTASPTTLSFLFIDVAKTISVTCSTTWSISGTTGGFITATKMNANTLSLKCSKNNGSDRTGTVTITDGTTQIIINVTQFSSAGTPQ